MCSKGGKIMNIKKILKSDVKKLLKHSAKDWQAYVPMQTKEGDVLFNILPKSGRELEEALQRVSLGDEWTAVSPKDIFFPQQEDIFYFDKDKIQQNIESSKKLIFGVKPCDVKGILFADEFFKRNFEDIYYLSRMKDRLIVTIGCLTPPRPQACFCTSVETGPFLEEGFDLQLVDMQDEYIVEVGSEKGKNFVALHKDLFKDVGESQREKIKNVKTEAARAIELKVDFDKALEIMKGNSNFDETYRQIGERCIYCGACLYTCPTCTCFNVFDETKKNKGVRRRNWDGCVFAGYTREASGHNPRDDKQLRTRRRYEHKLKYDYIVTGQSGCIGCGRCFASCPVQLGMSKFIEEITSKVLITKGS
jgi:ferredoxin